MHSLVQLGKLILISTENCMAVVLKKQTYKTQHLSQIMLTLVFASSQGIPLM